jgi:hypothetical protein
MQNDMFIDMDRKLWHIAKWNKVIKQHAVEEFIL